MASLEIHPAAQAEYEYAIRWYADKSIAVANRFVVEVQLAIEAICDHPDRYARADETNHFYLPSGFPYYIAYRQIRGSVQIVAIRHSSRDQDAWKAR